LFKPGRLVPLHFLVLAFSLPRGVVGSNEHTPPLAHTISGLRKMPPLEFALRWKAGLSGCIAMA
jgi:hypothetical protein